MSDAAEREPKADTAWLSQGERGALWLIRFTFAVANLLGRRFMKVVVAGIAMWYRLFDRRAVAASRQWLTRVHGTAPGFWRVYGHIRTFAQVTLDRIFLITDRFRCFQVTHAGHELLDAQVATGRGAVLLGAHLGSFEAMRAGSSKTKLRVRILGYFQNARMINELLTRLNPERAATVIHLGSDPVGVMANVRARIDAGDFVAVLGDRTGLNERTTLATFCGEEARFPSGPFLLASLLHCPVYLVFGIYRAPNRYELHCERFADRIDLPRGRREDGLREVVQRYATRLEHHARNAPDNWFNFFDFWSKP